MVDGQGLFQPVDTVTYLRRGVLLDVFDGRAILLFVLHALNVHYWYRVSHQLGPHCSNSGSWICTYKNCSHARPCFIFPYRAIVLLFLPYTVRACNYPAVAPSSTSELL